MERLTERRENGVIRVDLTKTKESVMKCDEPPFRLEDILGDEYDLDRLRELAQADREGRCVVLPCKVGDTVWAILDGAKYARECKVDFVNIGSFGTTIVFMTKDWLREQYGVAADAFGKTVFLTREEAKAALEAMKDGD